MLIEQVFGIKLAARVELFRGAQTFSELVPTEFRADVVLEVWENGATKPSRMIVVELQLEKKDRKRFSWPAYIAVLRSRFECPVGLIVVTLDDAVARWCAEPIDLDGWGMAVVRARVMGPTEVPWVEDIELARRHPELAVVSFLVHRDDEGAERVGKAVLLASRGLDGDREALYSDLVLANLNEAARRTLVADMSLQNYEFQSEFAKRFFAEGKAEGEARARRALVRAIVALLEGRQLHVSSEARTRLEAAEELDELEGWLMRAASVALSRTDLRLRATMRLVGNTRIEWWTTVEADDREQLNVDAWELRSIERAPRPSGSALRWDVILVEASP